MLERHHSSCCVQESEELLQILTVRHESAVEGLNPDPWENLKIRRPWGACWMVSVTERVKTLRRGGGGGGAG